MTSEALTERARKAARARWGRKRTLRLDTLPEPVRRAIEAMVAAEEQAQEREKAAA